MVDIKPISSPQSSVGSVAPKSGSEITNGPNFSDVLKGQAEKTAEAKLPTTSQSEGLKFSNHSIERMKSRGITMGPDQIAKLNELVNKAADKGSKDTLVLMGDSALVVSVTNRTVITAMDREALKENVFTNIDSTVVL
ncbi:MAG: hypothetical protein COT74_09165 [Bdellovibrionales bacterium CG10_big_fil_rev_8_21_14_0_10_45_34]|nr:MAG: hypothetical protein COT74_09165 [Bdellovibrionales bacterium CG10_big_fil_rev_8_21_14_0_10_45_34]